MKRAGPTLAFWAGVVLIAAGWVAYRAGSSTTAVWLLLGITAIMAYPVCGLVAAVARDVQTRRRTRRGRPRNRRTTRR